MNNIVWVFGSSAAGKETFIRKLLSNPSLNLINRLGWENKKIVCVEESLKYIARFENDPIAQKRLQIIERVKEIPNNSNTIILIKGQDVDLRSNLVNILRKEILDADHKIIFLHTDIQLLYERSQKKRLVV
jgi:predicted kinase